MHTIFNLYKVFLCPHCGLVQFVKEGQKKRRCPSSICRKIINLERVIVYGRTYVIQKAVAMVQKLKAKSHNLQMIDDIQPILNEEEDSR